MFGHQDDNNQYHDDAAANPAHDGVLTDDGQQPVDNTEPVTVEDHTDVNPSEYIVTEPVDNPALPPVDHPINAQPAATDDLLDIKQDALKQLSPLIGHLEQTPEEKFRTTMMMIQAADDQSLIKSAYEAAKEIADEKVRAQALLDIVNEINYFTHPGNNE